MFTSFGFSFLLSNIIQKEPGIIVGPISVFLGWIINFIFNIAYTLTTNHSLGISIIMLTIITRILMLPLAFKQQKSMVAMQRIQPEIEKIKQKYGNSKDPEIQQKISQETTALFSKNKVNPLSSFVPIIIQFPIFFALNYIMNQSYLFVTKLGEVYNQLAVKITEIPGFVDIIVPLARPKVPSGMRIDVAVVEDLMRVLNKFLQADWNTFLSQIPADAAAQVSTVLDHKFSIEMFLGITLTEVSGLAFPGVIIPVLAGLTTFLSSYVIQKMQPSSNPQAATQQKIMLIVMPIIMGVMTINFSAGVGIYWITSSVFQICQQLIMNERFFKKTKEKSS